MCLDRCPFTSQHLWEGFSLAGEVSPEPGPGHAEAEPTALPTPRLAWHRIPPPCLPPRPLQTLGGHQGKPTRPVNDGRPVPGEAARLSHGLPCEERAMTSPASRAHTPRRRAARGQPEAPSAQGPRHHKHEAVMEHGRGRGAGPTGLLGGQDRPCSAVLHR